MRRVFVVLFLLLSLVSPAFAQEPATIEEGLLAREPVQETLEARVIEVVEERDVSFQGSSATNLYQKLELVVTSGSLVGQTITIESGTLPLSYLQEYGEGDHVVVNYISGEGVEDQFFIVDFVRRESLAWLVVIFAVASIVIGRWYGFTSLIGMAISFVVIFSYILPQILIGQDPVMTAIIGSLAIAPVTFYLSHGLNKKTTVAIIGTLISLVITGILATTFVEFTKLTGYASEEAGFIQALRPEAINMKGLLLAGIIIGALGIFDDITVSQAAIVAKLKETKSKLTKRELYAKAMSIGHDHIASMVNTLILVYTGASLPLLLLFVDNPLPFSELINYEIIAEEIVRTLVGSIGLILAVPITSIIAAHVYGRDE